MSPALQNDLMNHVWLNSLRISPSYTRLVCTACGASSPASLTDINAVGIHNIHIDHEPVCIYVAVREERARILS